MTDSRPSATIRVQCALTDFMKHYTNGIVFDPGHKAPPPDQKKKITLQTNLTIQPYQVKKRMFRYQSVALLCRSDESSGRNTSTSSYQCVWVIATLLRLLSQPDWESIAICHMIRRELQQLSRCHWSRSRHSSLTSGPSLTKKKKTKSENSIMWIHLMHVPLECDTWRDVSLVWSWDVVKHWQRVKHRGKPAPLKNVCPLWAGPISVAIDFCGTNLGSRKNCSSFDILWHAYVGVTPTSNGFHTSVARVVRLLDVVRCISSVRAMAVQCRRTPCVMARLVLQNADVGEHIHATCRPQDRPCLLCPASTVAPIRIWLILSLWGCFKLTAFTSVHLTPSS